MLSALLLTGLLQATPPAPAPRPAPPAAPTLATDTALRVENHRLRVLVAELEQQLRTLALQQQRQQLEAELAQAHPGWRMDWQTGQLVPVVPAPESRP